MKKTISKIQEKTDCQIYILQIPLMAKPISDIERRIQNNTLNTNLPTELGTVAKIILTQEPFDDVPKNTIMESDGIHVSTEGACIISQAITKSMQGPVQRNKEQEPKGTPAQLTDINTITIEIPTDNGIVMGKEGRTQRKIERRTDTRIHIKRGGGQIFFHKNNNPYFIIHKDNSYICFIYTYFKC